MLFAALKPNIQSKKVTSVNCQHHLKQPIHPHEEVLQQPNDIGARAVQYGQNSNIAKNNDNNFMNIAIAIFFLCLILAIVLLFQTCYILNVFSAQEVHNKTFHKLYIHLNHIVSGLQPAFAGQIILCVILNSNINKGINKIAAMRFRNCMCSNCFTIVIMVLLLIHYTLFFVSLYAFRSIHVFLKVQ